MDNAPTALDDGLYPIGAVSALTGINSVTLRAWERRYGLLAPSRTRGGRRLYSEQDIDLIREVQRLIQGGVPIGQVVTRLKSNGSAPATGSPVAPGSWEGYQERMIDAIIGFDEARLEAVYNESLETHPMDTVVRRLLLPLMETLGRRWEGRVGSIAEEHFFTVYLRNKIGARFHHRPPSGAGPVLVVACLPGEQHEIGMLLFALSAQDRGFRVVPLGVNLPLQELPLVVERSAADAVVLSGSMTPVAGLLKHDLRQLVARLTIPVFIGGRVSTEQPHIIQAAGAIPVGEDLTLGLGHITAHEALGGRLNTISGRRV